jgi:hypothetical protein
MNKAHSLVLRGADTYNNCLITSCLKNFFTGTAKKTNESHFTISNHIGEVAKELEILNRDGIFEMSSLYFTTLEKCLPEAEFRYVVIYRNNAPVLFGYFQLFTLTSKNFNLEEDKSFSKGLLRFFLDLKKIKVLISGNTLRNEGPCYCFDDRVISKDEAAEIYTAAAEKLGSDECISGVILKDIHTRAKTKKFLSSNGYKIPWEDQMMVMDIDPEWTVLGDYIAALSRKYKTRANKILAAADKLTIKDLSEDHLHQYRESMHRLFSDVISKQSFVLTWPGDDHFIRLKKAYKDNFDVVGLFDGDKLVAFYSGFHTDDTYELYYVGFDYKHNTERQLYFNILFAGLERAILLKRKYLKLGRTSFDAKASLGAKPESTTYFLKTSFMPDAVSNWFVKYFSSMEDNKWKLRNPLKRDASPTLS